MEYNNIKKNNLTMQELDQDTDYGMDNRLKAVVTYCLVLRDLCYREILVITQFSKDGI
jgi:hypothetical protein